MITITPEYLASQGLSPTIVERFWAKIRKTKTHWFWIGSKTVYGYGQISNFSYQRPMAAHRVAWILCRGPIPDETPDVLHDCVPQPDIKWCVNPDHLYLGNHSINGLDAVAKGQLVALKGEEHPHAKLTSEQVREIRQRYADGDHAITEMGLEYGVSKHQIFMIVSRRKWASI